MRVNPGEYRTANSKQEWRAKLSAEEIRHGLKQLIADYEAIPTKERREILDFHGSQYKQTIPHIGDSQNSRNSNMKHIWQDISKDKEN